MRTIGFCRSTTSESEDLRAAAVRFRAANKSGRRQAGGADQREGGGGEEWSIARYGSLDGVTVGAEREKCGKKEDSIDRLCDRWQTLEVVVKREWNWLYVSIFSTEYLM